MKVNNFLLKHKGTIYLETLISLFIWVTILTLILPTFFRVTKNRQELLIKTEATRILTQQVIKWSKEESLQNLVEGNYRNYQIMLNDNKEKTTICVQYENIEEKAIHDCRVLQ